MKIGDYLSPDAVILLEGRTKAAAIDEVIRVLATRMDSATAEELAAAVWERERLMSTGIGQGLAFPHVRLRGLSGAAIAVGVSRAGIADYEGLDGAPVHIIVLIAAPQGQHELYIRLLALVANLLKDPAIRSAVIAADDASAVHSILIGGGI
jgi:PTS system nitrogen regulatory IIA component